MKTITMAISLALISIFLGVLALNAEVYTWTDEDGIKHFSDRPPEDPKNRVKPLFPEYKHDEAADKKRTESDKKKLKKIVKSIDDDYDKKQREEKRQQEEAEKNRPPTLEEKVAAESAKLQQTITDLEGKPLEYFGSQRNKILTIGHYQYRLEDLARDPERYFREGPPAFEGNVKNPAEDAEQKP
jgi:hypothetical protein